MEQIEQPEKWGSVKQACDFWQVTRRTIYNWLGHGKIKSVRTPGGLLRIKLEYHDVRTKPARVKPVADNICGRCKQHLDKHVLVNYSIPPAYGEEGEVGEQALICPTGVFLEAN